MNLGSPSTEKIPQPFGQAFLPRILRQLPLSAAGDEATRSSALRRQHPAIHTRSIAADDACRGVDPAKPSDHTAGRIEVLALRVASLHHATHIAQSAILCQGTLDKCNSVVALILRLMHCALAQRGYSSRPPHGVIVSKTQKLYRDWVRRGLKKKGKNGKGLAAALGISPAQVSRMLKDEETMKPGEKPPRSIQIEELAVIAAYIEEEVPGDRNNRTVHLAQGSAAVPLVRVLAIVAPAVWREVGVQVALAERVPASPDPRAAGMQQYACKIEAEPNRYAICVPYGDARVKPIANDTVHVRRTNQQGLFEDTLRVVRVSNGSVRLEAGNGKNKDAVAYPAKAGEIVEIKGLVIGYFEPIVF